MKHVFFIKALGLSLLLTGLTVVGNSQGMNYWPNRIVVRMNPMSNKSNVQGNLSQILDGYDYRFKPVWNPAGKEKSLTDGVNLESIFIVDFQNDIDVLSVVKQLSANKLVAYAEPYFLQEFLEVPNDPLIKNQYYLSKIQAFEAHNITTGDTNIVIGIVDMGVELTHQDLKENIKYNYKDPINGVDDDFDGYTDNFYGWDISEGDNNPNNTNYNHGTRVAGLVSAITNNNFGIASVGYHTKILPVKIATDNGFLTGTYEGVLYAADHGCKIINCSWGGKTYSQFGADIINYAIHNRGCLVVAAAGNDKTDEPFYPASYPDVLSVAASNQYDNKWNGSSWGIYVDICAPGENIYSTGNANGFVTGNGTSYASPLVAGAAALLMDRFPDLNALQIAQKLRICSDVIDTTPENLYFKHLMGYGRLNVHKALTDSTLPAVRISNIIVADLSGQYPQAGDTLKVSCSFTNYLYQTSNTVVKLTSDSPEVTFLKNTFTVGELKALESVNNHETPFLVRLLPSTPQNETLRFTFEIADESYSDYQHFEILVNLDFVNLADSHIETTICSNGKIGYSNKEKNLGLGILYHETQTLFDGGLILATGTGTMASAVQGVYEFNALSGIDTFLLDESYSAFTSFEPLKSKWDAGFKVFQKVTMNPYNLGIPAILYEYKIENLTDELISGLRAGVFTNWNLDNEWANMTNFEPNLNLHYTYSNSNNVLFAGTSFLNKADCNPYSFDLISGGNGGLDITSSFSDEQKWFAMQTYRPVAGNNGDSIDVAGLLSSASITIQPFDSAKFAFALILADNYNQLSANTLALLSQYRFQPTEVETLALASAIKVYPNPAGKFINIALTNDEQIKSWLLYDLNGQIVIGNSSTGTSSLSLDLTQITSGIYFIKVLTNTSIYFTKILVVR